MPIAFALDEDVAHQAANLLRARGHAADSAKQLGRLGLSDPQVLLRAARAGQTLVTHHSKDFRALHEAWVTWRWHWSNEVAQHLGHAISLSPHAGILITPHLPIHELVRSLEAFQDSAGAMNDRLFAWTPARGWHEPYLAP